MRKSKKPEIEQFIEDHLTKTGLLPKQKDIAAALEISAVGVHKHMKKLKWERGFPSFCLHDSQIKLLRAIRSMKNACTLTEISSLFQVSTPTMNGRIKVLKKIGAVAVKERKISVIVDIPALNS